MTWLIFICVFLVLVLVFVLFVLIFKLLSVLRIAGDTNGLVERLGEISSCQLSADKLDNLFNQVSALSKILGGVKTKGVWGEAQLLAIFEDIMTSNQYVRNVSTKNNSSRVEFAVKIPSKSNDSQFVFLPVDSKCFMESYSRIVDYVNSGDYEGFVSEQKVLAQRVKAEAKSICEKYINPPVTTDFAVMFVPIESMYSEILRIDGLFTWCQTNCHVLIAGPTVLTALVRACSHKIASTTIAK